jgi:UDP-3-O-[3-hydroxymyristoyl] glucosamine N-acyltransferase
MDSTGSGLGDSVFIVENCHIKSKCEIGDIKQS